MDDSGYHWVWSESKDEWVKVPYARIGARIVRNDDSSVEDQTED